jgi:hypothetical protein
MAVDDVALALIDLHDPDIRSRVAQGDLSDLPGGLTDEETEMLVTAAGDDPEVEGFSVTESEFYVPLTYVANNRRNISPDVRSQFNSFFSQRWGGAWSIPLMG